MNKKEKNTMTAERAAKIIEASIACEERKTKVDFEEQCDRHCENCKLCYEIGTQREYKEAQEFAVKVLQEKAKDTPAESQKEVYRCVPFSLSTDSFIATLSSICAKAGVDILGIVQNYHYLKKLDKFVDEYTEKDYILSKTIEAVRSSAAKNTGIFLDIVPVYREGSTVYVDIWYHHFQD